MYRLLEVLPGTLSWATIALMVLLSWLTPAYVAVFIILFDIYWLLKTVFFSLHLRAAFRKMRENLRVNWLKKLEEGRFRFEDVRHLVILPMVDEPYALVRESFETLARSEYPKEKFFVVLATEDGGVELHEDGVIAYGASARACGAALLAAQAKALGLEGGIADS